jgi:epoxyqueuosine reductase
MVDNQKMLTASNAVQDALSELGVDAIGVALLEDLKGTKLEEAALRLLPETHSIVVLAMEIYREILDQARPERKTGFSSMNDLLERNTDYLSGRLTKAAYDVAKACHLNGLKALPLPAAGCPTDTRFLQAVFSYKHAAQAAGLGYIGRSSLLITPDFGPRVRLSCCLTEAILNPTHIANMNMCEDCNVCVDNCPSSALNRPLEGESYTINKFACNAFRVASGGCSECMRVCPSG